MSEIFDKSQMSETIDVPAGCLRRPLETIGEEISKEEICDTNYLNYLQRNLQNITWKLFDKLCLVQGISAF